MRLAVIRAQFLTLLRDRSALAMAFLLPPVFFAVFALIFSNAASGDLTVKAAIAAPDTLIGQRIAGAVGQGERISVVVETTKAEEVRQAVRDGRADAGLVIVMDEGGDLSFEIISDPSRQVAASLVEAAIAGVTGADAPQVRLRQTIDYLDANIVSFTPEQREQIEARLATLNPDSVDFGAAPPVRITPLGGLRSATASYYAIAVTMLFLFLSALQGALSLIESRESGIFERLAVSPGGAGVVVDGTFLFLTAQGVAQGVVIFALAALAFDVPVLSHSGVIVVVVFCAALAAAGLTLAVVSLCASRRQAHSLGTILILLMAALGGAMAPRILMPETIRAVGAFMPPAWGIEAVTGVVVRGGGMMTIVPWCALLVLAGAAGLIVARVAVRRY